MSCQNSYVLVIGDGAWSYHNQAASRVSRLLNQHKIKTFTVAYGGGISGSGIRNFRRMAQVGGTNDVIIANTTASLKSQLKAAALSWDFKEAVVLAIITSLVPPT